MRRRVGTAVRSAREVAASLREAPFRAALAVSALLHVLLFLGVRIGPPAGVRLPTPAMRLQIIRVLPEAEVAAALAPPPSPAPVRTAPDRPGRRGGVDARPPASAAPDPVPPAPVALPAGPIPAPPAAVAAPSSPTEQAVAAIEPAATPPAPLAAASAADAPPVASPAASAGTGAEAAGATTVPSAADAGGGAAAAAPVAGGAGAPAGTPAHPGAESTSALPASAAGGSGSGPAASASLADLRRRIDARKVYPQIAVRNGWEGRVLVEMRLGDDGRLAGLRLLEGSGYAVLDEATLAAVRRAAPFPPVAGPVAVPVEYRLTP